MLTGYSRRYEAEADAFANIYFQANEVAAGRHAFRQVLRKLQYNQDFYDPENSGSSFLSTHPEIRARIDVIEKSEMGVFPSENVFYGYDKAGDLVAPLSFQGQRSYTGTLNPDDAGLQIVALVETTSALGDKDKIRDIRLKSGGRTIKLDNKEDTEILPNDAVGASFVTKELRSLLGPIQGIELNLRNVARWERSAPE